MCVKPYQTKGNVHSTEARKKILAGRSLSLMHRGCIEKEQWKIINKFMGMSVKVIDEEHILQMT
jgi:hypothetical protein